MTTQAQAKRDEQQAAIEQLLALLPKGTTVHTILRHRTRSGMQRSISPLAADPDYGIGDFSSMVARAIGWKFDQVHGGVKVDGAGMDMGFHLVYTLSRVLHGDGYALKHRWI